MAPDEADPGPHRAALLALGPDLADAVAAIQGLLIHGAALAVYGLAPGTFDRATPSVAGRLGAILAADPAPLTQPRPPAGRSLGTCRDYALLVCAAMRAHGREARVRCGFADYFSGGPWEDHWICELREGARWRRVDAQLDALTQAAHGVALDATDLPEGRYLGADEAWQACRAGRWPPEAFAHGDEARGLWFMRVNVMRDRLALAGRIASPWDRWREAGPAHRRPGDAEIARTDAVAAGDAAPAAAPPW